VRRCLFHSRSKPSVFAAAVCLHFSFRLGIPRQERAVGSLLGFAAAEIFRSCFSCTEGFTLRAQSLAHFFGHSAPARLSAAKFRSCTEFSYCEFPVAPQVREPKDFLTLRSACFGRCSILACLDPVAAPKDSSYGFLLGSTSQLVLALDPIVFVLGYRTCFRSLLLELRGLLVALVLRSQADLVFVSICSCCDSGSICHSISASMEWLLVRARKAFNEIYVRRRKLV
jgi:hypothetical protein